MLPEIDKVMASPGWDNILKLEPEAAAAVVESITGDRLGRICGDSVGVRTAATGMNQPCF